MAVSSVGLFYLLVVVNIFSCASGESVFGKLDPELNLADEVKDYVKETWCNNTNYLDVCKDLFDFRSCFVDLFLFKLWNLPNNNRQHDDAKQKLSDLYAVINCDENDTFTYPELPMKSKKSFVWVIVLSSVLCCVLVGNAVYRRIKKGKCSLFNRVVDI